MSVDFASIVGADAVQPGEGSVDDVPIERVVRPASARQVADCLKAAAAAGRAVLARGGGSKLGWGNPLAADSVDVLDLRRLDAPRDVQPDEGIATLGAGVELAALETQLAEQRQTSLLEPLHPGATVGGAVAADPVGPAYTLDRRLRWDLLGLEVALPGGELTRCGGRVVKNVSGFDLVRLYCGSFGTLGIITQVTVRLRPLPACRRALARDFKRLDDALAAAAGAADEIGEGGALAVVPGSDGVRLVAHLEGREAAVERGQRALGGAPDAAAWDDLRRRIVASDGAVAIRVGCRPSELAEVAALLASHAGSEAVRALLPRAGVAFADVSEPAGGEVVGLLRERGYAVFVERAPVALRAGVEVHGPPADTIGLMRALKQRFDPGGTLAPGRAPGRI